MLENLSANRVLACETLFGLGAFDHVRYTYVVFVLRKPLLRVVSNSF